MSSTPPLPPPENESTNSHPANFPSAAEPNAAHHNLASPPPGTYPPGALIPLPNNPNLETFGGLPGRRKTNGVMSCCLNFFYPGDIPTPLFSIAIGIMNLVLAGVAGFGAVRSMRYHEECTKPLKFGLWSGVIIGGVNILFTCFLQIYVTRLLRKGINAGASLMRALLGNHFVQAMVLFIISQFVWAILCYQWRVGDHTCETWDVWLGRSLALWWMIVSLSPFFLVFGLCFSVAPHMRNQRQMANERSVQGPPMWEITAIGGIADGDAMGLRELGMDTQQARRSWLLGEWWSQVRWSGGESIGDTQPLVEHPSGDYSGGLVRREVDLEGGDRTGDGVLLNLSALNLQFMEPQLESVPSFDGVDVPPPSPQLAGMPCGLIPLVPYPSPRMTTMSNEYLLPTRIEMIRANQERLLHSSQLQPQYQTVAFPPPPAAAAPAAAASNPPTPILGAHPPPPTPTQSIPLAVVLPPASIRSPPEPVMPTSNSAPQQYVPRTPPTPQPTQTRRSSSSPPQPPQQPPLPVTPPALALLRRVEEPPLVSRPPAIAQITAGSRRHPRSPGSFDVQGSERASSWSSSPGGRSGNSDVNDRIHIDRPTGEEEMPPLPRFRSGVIL